MLTTFGSIQSRPTYASGQLWPGHRPTRVANFTGFTVRHFRNNLLVPPSDPDIPQQLEHLHKGTRRNMRKTNLQVKYLLKFILYVVCSSFTGADSSSVHTGSNSRFIGILLKPNGVRKRSWPCFNLLSRHLVVVTEKNPQNTVRTVSGCEAYRTALPCKSQNLFSCNSCISGGQQHVQLLASK